MKYLHHVGLGCNDIALAVASKSELDLQRALTASPHAINEPNNMGQTALHLAVDWPVGMQRLLEAGADVDCHDCAELSPLDYAIQMSLIEPVHMLGQAGCSLPSSYNRSVLKAAINFEEICRSFQTRNAAAKMILDHLVDLLIERRQRLYDLAIRLLPASALSHFYPNSNHNSYLLDENASQLFSTLLHHDIPVPLALDPGKDRTTVYHQIDASCQAAERLYKGGFRDIDGKDFLGLTPVMSLCVSRITRRPMIMHLECLAWFLDKGASLHAKQDMTLYKNCKEERVQNGSRQLVSATSLQFIAQELGKSLAEHVDTWFLNESKVPLKTSLSANSRRVFGRVAMDNKRDDYRCACSIGGCKAFTLLMKGYLDWGYGGFQYLANLWAQVTELCDPLNSSEFLRFMTFEEQRLTHTCCRNSVEYYRDRHTYYSIFSIGDQAEIDEINDEQGEDLQKLDELLEEFEAKMTELDLPFLDFIHEYWWPRMCEVHREGRLDKEALKEIGVRVHENDWQSYSASGWIL